MIKRFELRLCSNGTYYVYENGTLTDIDFDKFNKESADDLIDKVNALYNEKEKLKQFQEQVASVIECKMGDNVCNDYKMEVLKEIWNELELDEVWFE